MTLEELRSDIDRLDERILSLLGERMEKALLTRSFKDGVRDGGREETVLERARRPVRRLLSPVFATGIWSSIMAESRELQGRGLRTIGFRGDHGAWGEVAALAWDGGFVPMPCREFFDIIDAVREGRLDRGILPATDCMEGLRTDDSLRIVAAIDLPSTHCLLALPGTDHREIRQVWSSAESLVRCRGFLARNRLEPMPFPDAAGAARMIAETRPRAAAALGSRLAAELYGLEAIKEGIEDSTLDRTRFLVVAGAADAGDTAAGVAAGAAAGGQAEAGYRRKCSAVFHADDRSGALARALEPFTRAGINLTRIESVPDGPGGFSVSIDIEGDEGDGAVSGALCDASIATQGFRVLGCYGETRR